MSNWVTWRCNPSAAEALEDEGVAGTLRDVLGVAYRVLGPSSYMEAAVKVAGVGREGGGGGGGEAILQQQQQQQEYQQQQQGMAGVAWRDGGMGKGMEGEVAYPAAAAAGRGGCPGGISMVHVQAGLLMAASVPREKVGDKEEEEQQQQQEEDWYDMQKQVGCRKGALLGGGRREGV